MKKLMLTLTIAFAMIAGTTYAQAPVDAGTSPAVKKEKISTLTPAEKEDLMIKKNEKREAGNIQGKAATSKKTRILKHKEEIKANADTKEEAKEYIQEKHQDQNDVTQKEKVKAHKDQIIEKAGSKEAAKAKLQRKHDNKKD